MGVCSIFQLKVGIDVVLLCFIVFFVLSGDIRVFKMKIVNGKYLMRQQHGCLLLLFYPSIPLPIYVLSSLRSSHYVAFKAHILSTLHQHFSCYSFSPSVFSHFKLSLVFLSHSSFTLQSLSLLPLTIHSFCIKCFCSLSGVDKLYFNLKDQILKNERKKNTLGLFSLRRIENV